MSTWTVRAIERLGAPDVLWPTVYGPATGADPVAANGLATLDLTPDLWPLSDFSMTMERDLTKSSFSSIKIDLSDPTGALADALGPGSATMAAADRYYGPWIEVVENWGSGTSALRFLGYVDETSVQWNEEDAKTQITVIHSSQLLRERLITDFPELLRPWPSVPTNSSQSFLQRTADALLQAAAPTFTPRLDAAAQEAALWAQGQLTWKVSRSESLTSRLTSRPDQDPVLSFFPATYPVPSAAAASVIIGGTGYAVDHVAWDTTIVGEVQVGDPAGDGVLTTYHPVRIYLQGMPNLTGILHAGDTVTWGVPEAQRTHYLLNGGSIIAPASGSDGAKYVDLNTVDQLAPGDVLTLTFVDSGSGVPRRTSADLPVIIDLDGELGRAHLAQPLTQGYTNVSKVRRNSQDPVLFDGVAYARALIAPFTLDTTQFKPAPTDIPVLVWQPYDVANPPLYGVHNLQTVNQTGGMLLARRGANNGLGAYPTMGVWAGAWGGTWAWLGLPAANSTHEIYGDVLQFPGGTNPYAAPVIYTEGDLSAGATTPPNGWRSAWRTWKAPSVLTQDPESTWDGSAVSWASATATGDIPAKVVAFAASTLTPGRYTRTSAGVWTFNAHTGSGTLGSGSTPTLTGSVPSGNWLALGMGIWASGDEKEGLLGLVATGASFPFSEVKAVLFSQAAGGNLTLQQAVSLWTTGAIPAGPWALGGGLVVQTYAETIDGLVYPRTRLHKLNGTTVVTADLKTLEVIPQTIQPLLLTGAAGAKVIGGWYALALETYADDNYAAARRLRFLNLDAGLNLLNGDLEADPSTPTNLDDYFRRGELIASLVPDGALIAKMVRTSNTENRMAGVIGGRIFTVANELPTTVERLKLGASIPQSGTLSVAHSRDGLSVADYLEKFAAAQLATAVPAADGNMALVSRSAGTLQTRLLSGQRVSVQGEERAKRSKTQAWQGYLRKVRVSYADLLADANAAVEEVGSFDGGRILQLDLSDLVSGSTMARALARATVYWFGQPAPLLNETWVDAPGGVQDAMLPVFWSDWKVGDLVTFTAYDPAAPSPLVAYKLLRLRPGLEARSVDVELRQQPFLITPGA